MTTPVINGLTGASDPAETLPNAQRSDWSAVVGQSPVQSVGAVMTIVTLTHTPSGKSIQQDFRYDGSLLDLLRQVRAAVERVDSTTGKVQVLVPGTVLDLNDPMPPPPPTQEELDREAYFGAKRKVQMLTELLALNRADVTTKMLTDVTTEWNALPFVASYEGL